VTSEIIRATAADLPDEVAQALRHPAEPTDGRVEVGGTAWATLSWGAAGDPPLLMVHGVTSEASTFWRLGPAVAASGRYVVAVDLPGHGRTGGWSGRHRFADTAAELATFIGAVGFDRPDLAVLGHSWGGMIVAALPSAGIAPATLILLDPPYLTPAQLEPMTRDPVERFYDDPEEAIVAIRAAYPEWTDGDVRSKALGLSRFDIEAVRAVLLDNGTWDAGLAALADPAAANVPVWYIRGELQHGGLIPEPAIPALVARAGAGRVLTIEGGPHSPQRTHPEATVLAVLRSLAGR
jgi:pimeloyl-ACP methyl ester carboxylesterase